MKTPSSAFAPLGFGVEYWDSNPEHYEGWQRLRDRFKQLAIKRRRRQLAYELADTLLDDVVVAAGGVERAVAALRANADRLGSYAQQRRLRSKDGVPIGLALDASIDAWYSFADVLWWGRTLAERVDRAPRDKKHGRQGLVPAIKAKRLRKRCQALLAELTAGPVGQSRSLSNFMLHSALANHPFTGVKINSDGTVSLPIPDLPQGAVAHWYLLTWKQQHDGFAFAELLWESTKTFMDALLDAFERAVPKRLRRST